MGGRDRKTRKRAIKFAIRRQQKRIGIFTGTECASRKRSWNEDGACLLISDAPFIFSRWDVVSLHARFCSLDNDRAHVFWVTVQDVRLVISAKRRAIFSRSSDTWASKRVLFPAVSPPYLFLSLARSFPLTTGNKLFFATLTMRMGFHSTRCTLPCCCILTEIRSGGWERGRWIRLFPQLGNIKVENINCSPFECSLIDFYGRSSDRNNSVVTTWTTMIRRAGFLFLFLSRLIYRPVGCLHCAAYTRCVLTSGSELILSAKCICASGEKRTL